MTTIIRKTLKVGADGNVVISVGAAAVGTEVDVTVSPRSSHPKVADMSREEYERFANSLFGSWIGDFEEPADLPLEKRDEL